ncbi:hypothetical protein Gpo141_00003736 [Globisporangium polare]
MVQAIDSGSDLREFFGALMDESGGDFFFFELDSLLQCVDDFDHSDSLSPAAAATTTTTTTIGAGFGDVKLEKTDESLLRDDDIWLTSSVAMFDTPIDVTRDPSPTRSCLSSPANDAGTARRPSRRKRVTKATATQAPTNPEAPKKKVSQNRSRKRQRDEIDGLRTTANELQVQLEALLGGSSKLGLRSETHMQIYLRESLAWKRAASSEQQEAERGAVENLKLRALIQETALICKNLSDTCCKSRASKVPRIGSAFTYVDMEKPVVLPHSATFESLRQGLDAQYQSQPTVWEECNFTNGRTESKRPPNKLRSDGSGQLFFEHATSHLFPFSPKAVSQAIWKLTKGGLLTPNNGELKICRVMGNTLYATLNDTISIPYTPDSKISVWVTMKRFIEDDQVVMVWRAKVEIKHTSTVRFNESGWRVMRGVAGANAATGSSTSAPCIAQTCIRSFPEPDFPVSSDEMVIGSMTWKVVGQYHENMSMLDQQIENMLLDESMGNGCS